MQDLNVKIIGLGGIGSFLSDIIARYLNSIQGNPSTLVLVDGDEYEFKNKERQEFSSFGNKAVIKSRDLRRKFDNLIVEEFPFFITEDNVHECIKNGDIILLGVDNHKTRKIVSEFCDRLEDVTLISGGNDYTDGNVQIYIRKEGKSKTASLTAFHPEIANPVDKLPDEMSCEELHSAEPQLLFTNFTVAAIMCWAFYNNVILNDHRFGEVYFDIISMSADARERHAN